MQKLKADKRQLAQDRQNLEAEKTARLKDEKRAAQKQKDANDAEKRLEDDKKAKAVNDADKKKLEDDKKAPPQQNDANLGLEEGKFGGQECTR